MAEIKIDVIDVEIFQRFIELFGNVLARKPPIVCAFARREEHFGRNDVFVSGVTGKDFAEKPFGFAARIGVGAVEKVYARVERRVDGRGCRFHRRAVG